MKTTTRSLFALCFLLCSGAVLAQDHGVTYVKKGSQPDDIINIGGQSNTVVKIPVTEISTGAQFVVIFPAPPDFFSASTTAVVSTIHSSDSLNSNSTIDSFPAAIQVIDGLNYILSGDATSGYDFLVTGSVTVSVSVDIGDTIVTVSNSLDASSGGLPFLTNVNIPGPDASANAVSSAEWNKYVDQVGLVAALDKWVDYIRVLPR